MQIALLHYVRFAASVINKGIKILSHHFKGKSKTDIFEARSP